MSSEKQPSFVERLRNNIQSVGATVKSLDGIDESAQALDAILPGLAGPLAAACVLSLATPFVYWGCGGQKEEYDEACKEYDEILQNKQETHEKLRALVTCSDKWRGFVAKKLKLEFSPSTAAASPGSGINDFAKAVADLEALKNKEFVAVLGKKYGWTGVLGMAGMFVGMLPSVAESSIDAASLITGTTNATLTVASSGLAIASGAAFGVGQIAMLAYAGNKARQGKAIDKTLHESRELFRKHSYQPIDFETREAILGILDKDIDFNKKTRIQYGVATVVGQKAMLAATILNLVPGPGTALSIPFVAVGAPVTIGAAIWRIVYERKEGKFRGEGENDFSRNRVERTALPVLFKRSLSATDNTSMMKELEKEFTTCSHQLAHIKLFSLLHGLISHSATGKYKYKDGKFAYLEKILENNDINTGLNSDVVDQVKTIFHSNNNVIRDILSCPRPEADKMLLANILKYTDSPEDNSALIANVTAADNKIDCADLPALLKSLDIEQVFSDSRIDDDYTKLNKHLLPRLKNSLKFIRHDIADKFVQVSHIEEVKTEIANERRKEDIAPLSPYQVRAPLVKPRPKLSYIESISSHIKSRPTHKDGYTQLYHSPTHATQTGRIREQPSTIFSEVTNAMHKDCYTELKESLIPTQQLTFERIREQQEKLDRFRTDSTKFIQVKKSNDDKGNTIIVWDDPSMMHRGKTDYQITYVINDCTKKISVKYGANASAIVASDSNIENTIGVRLLEITQGKHAVLGDIRNQRIDVSMSGLAVTETTKHRATLATTRQEYRGYAR